MSKLQLRSKRRTASPSGLKGTAKEGPSNKRFKQVKNAKSSESSESSSDDFVAPPEDFKINTNGISRKSGPSPIPDFSSIESNIFLGVSRLSESDSNDSDFEDVQSTSGAMKAKGTKLLAPVSNKDGDGGGSKPLRNSLSKQGKSRQKEDSEEHKESKVVEDEKCTPQAKNARATRSRSTKTKPTETEAVNGKTAKGRLKSKEADQSKSSATKGKGIQTNIVDGKDRKKLDSQNVKHKAKQSKVKEEEMDKASPVKKEFPDVSDNLDIAQLLALGEGLIMETKSSEHSDSDGEDWEEVDPNDAEKHEFPKEGVQITLQAPEFSWKRKKQKDQQACLQAEMNRAFNRVRKELQLLCHKASLLLWLGHGIFLNRVINTDSVKAMALSLIPNDLTTLPKKPGSKYIDLLLKWFSKEFECSEGFPETLESSQSSSLGSVLEKHFSRKYAKSTKELTFMFITILRAVGLESRLIISFQPMPLKPQSGELLAIKSTSGRGRKGRLPKKESGEDEELEDNPSPTREEVVKSSRYFKQSTSPNKLASKTVKETAPERAAKERRSKVAAQSEPSSSGTGAKTVKKGISGGKSDVISSKSPPKTRQSRGKASKKSYSEKTDSDSSDENEDSKPILSPDRKKNDDKSLTERLKAAAAKRLPPSKRRSGSCKADNSSSPRKGKISQDSSESDFEPKPKRSLQAGKSKRSVPPQKPSTSRQSGSQESDSDSDFESKPKPKPRRDTKSKSPVKGKTPVRRRQSKADDDSIQKQLTSSGSDYWVEVYLKDEEKWACVDVPSKKIDSTAAVLAKATQPVCYVVAFNVEGTIKDVTKRYSPKFSQVTTKQRVSSDWWEKSMKPFKAKNSKREAAEDSEMNLVELDRPMPKSVGECKNHPLYVLKRHLLKFEAIYPPDSPSLGFVRNEAIYARQNVYNLHSREIWMKEAKVVKLGEEPYKIVKARPKYDRMSGKTITDLPLEVFGPWQVEDYVPPPAVDGKVPRNAYGNVELFKPTMLPRGCVHLQVPGLTRVAKKLRIDCAPAVVGFDYHSGGCHPTYDGFVVCEEVVDVLMDAWNKEIDESAKRREEKHEKRVYGNWRRLIKGLMIREQLKYRYDFNAEAQDEAGSSQSSVNADVLKASRISTDAAPLPSLFPKLMAHIRNNKSRQRKSTTTEKKSQTKSKGKKQDLKAKGRRKGKNETSEEEESEWDSSSTEEDESGMVLLSDEDSGSEFEDLKK